MRINLLFIFLILTVSCQPDSSRKSEDAFRNGIQALEDLSDKGEPNYDAAYVYFVQAANLNPDNISAQYWKSFTEMRIGRFSDALSTTTTTLESQLIDDGDLKPNILVIAGVASKRLGREGHQYFQRALDIYETRIGQNGDNFDAIMQKAIILLHLDRKNDAIKFLNGLSLNNENLILLEQFKRDIENFDPDSVFNNLRME